VVNIRQAMNSYPARGDTPHGDSHVSTLRRAWGRTTTTTAAKTVKEKTMAMLNRKEAMNVEAFHFQNIRSDIDVETGRRNALNELRKLCEDDPVRIIEFDGAHLDRETRALLEQLKIIAMKQQGRRIAYQS